ncbi:glycosyltransferase family 9 protein [Trinickia violacea]|uniref:Glycosyltransferase family 9 protein n=1 Tax=Trinickia violacea TaxID=2571746 RepID=A0A4P8IPD9_9BURK|nr:glycosyltransferase family 9 protein [Trinickia violacea]QCP48724.1 glycosyltransferase family 9 protein [Trinickia violacea]
MAALFSSSRPPRNILVVVTRRIGDVLLTTPIVRSLKARWPDTPIDMLVFRGTEGILEHNPDVRRVIVVAQRARFSERLADAARLWRRYDLACAAVSSDRPRFYTWFAGKKRIGLVDPNRVTWLVRFMLHGIAINHHESVHTVNSTLALAPLVGIEPRAEVVAPGIGDDPERRAQFDARIHTPPGVLPGQPYVVLHPYPMFAYKRWHIEGWVELIGWLRAQGYAIALSGGPAAAEREYAERVAAAAGGPVLNMAGQLSLGESAEMIRGAKLYVGPDTGATHIAAATGTPTIALFGPSDPVRWGPWPCGWPAGVDPWPLVGSGRHANVYLLQGEGDCVPCKGEGCERHVESHSECLTTLSGRRVIGAAAEMLGLPTPPLEAEHASQPAEAIVDTSLLGRQRGQ